MPHVDLMAENGVKGEFLTIKHTNTELNQWQGSFLFLISYWHV